MTVTPCPYRMTDDEIIDVRDVLLARGDIASLSVHDQDLFRDCDIALGVVRCPPQSREEARVRISRVKNVAPQGEATAP